MFDANPEASTTKASIGLQTNRIASNTAEEIFKILKKKKHGMGEFVCRWHTLVFPVLLRLYQENDKLGGTHDYLARLYSQPTKPRVGI